MKTNKLLQTLATGFLLAITVFTFAPMAKAQTFTTLYKFSTNGIVGVGPYGIILSGNTLFGVTYGSGFGGPIPATVFSMNTNGTGITTLHNFTLSEGRDIIGDLVLSGDTLYGTATSGGTSDSGTVFAVKTNGTGFTVLHHFTAIPNDNIGANTDGGYPYAGLITSGSTLYGTTAKGGTNSSGTVFAINTDGTGLTVLHHFNGGGAGDSSAKLALSGNILYGTTRYGGTSGVGRVFSLTTGGTGFTVLHNFAGGSDGFQPVGGLVLSGNILYGTTSKGGTSLLGSPAGTVFKMNTDGSSFATLKTFIRFDTNGVIPAVSLIISGNTLYGTTLYGGLDGYQGYGTAFTLQTDGSGFATLHSFSLLGSDGNQPFASLNLAGSTLYGTTDTGGGAGFQGTVYSIALPCAPAVMAIAQYTGVSVAGTIGCTYRIDYTLSLTTPITWTPLTTNTLSSSPYLYIDTAVPSGSRFYRAVVQ